MWIVWYSISMGGISLFGLFNPFSDNAVFGVGLLL